MTVIATSTKTALKADVFSLYHAINRNNQSQAQQLLGQIEMNITIYYHTRGLGTDRFASILLTTRNLLYRFQKTPLYKKRVFSYLFKLNKELRAMPVIAAEQGGNGVNPIVTLKFIADELMDDYSAFNLSGGAVVVQRNREILELIRNDLLEIKDLEPLFEHQPRQLRNQFNSLCKAVNVCLIIIPQVKDVSISAGIAKHLREGFEALFAVIANMTVPVVEESSLTVPVVIDGKLSPVEASPEVSAEQIIAEQIERQEQKGSEPSEPSAIHDEDLFEGIDLAELERRAEQSSVDKSKEEEKNGKTE